MGKKKYFGSDNIISIYKLMEICGLSCPTRGNIAVSHKIALRKLELRYRQNPDSVAVPRLVPFKAITSEDVRSGRIILVRDDCKNICGYLKPSQFLTLRSVEKIYDDLYHNASAYDYEEEIEEREDIKIKPGEEKYLRRHQRDSKLKKLPYIDDLTSKDKEKIRKKLLSEYLKEEDKIKPGEIRYNKRKKLEKEGC